MAVQQSQYESPRFSGGSIPRASTPPSTGARHHVALNNAAAEAFNPTLKVEFVHRHHLATRAEARIKAATRTASATTENATEPKERQSRKLDTHGAVRRRYRWDLVWSDLVAPTIHGHGVVKRDEIVRRALGGVGARAGLRRTP